MATTDDSMSDDVFEETDIEEIIENKGAAALDVLKNSKIINKITIERTPSPSGYPGYKPSKEALRFYDVDSEHINVETDDGDQNLNNFEKNEDGWQSYKIEEDINFDENFAHKVYSNKRKFTDFSIINCKLYCFI